MATIIGGINPTADLDDFLPGTAQADVILGLDGRDIIDGLGGNDSLIGGSEDDLIAGGAGNDTINGGGANDTMIGALNISDLANSNQITPETVTFLTDPLNPASGVAVQTFGSGQVDVIVGSNDITLRSRNLDTIYLGIAGTPFYVGQGNGDLAIVFGNGTVLADNFIMGGSALNYTTAPLTVVDPTTPGANLSGTGIFYNVTDATGAVVGQDAIALIVDATAVNLNSGNFVYQA